jgi:hypothetical protein
MRMIRPNWQQEGLKKSWNSRASKIIRIEVISPCAFDSEHTSYVSCDTCHETNTYGSKISAFFKYVEVDIEQVSSHQMYGMYNILPITAPGANSSNFKFQIPQRLYCTYERM